MSKRSKHFHYLCKVTVNGYLYVAFVTTAYDEKGHYVDDFYLKRAGFKLELSDYEAEWIFGYLNQELAKVGT